jgi:preprotein translocase subunit SecB
MTEPQQPAATFQIEKIYVKDLSLEIPHAPQVFAEQAQPQIDVRIESGETRFQPDYYEVTLSVTVTARAGERTVFLAEAVQGGIFAMRNIPEADLGPLLGIACPTVLFPYLRETISDLITASRSSAREPGALRSPACSPRASRSRSGRAMRSRRARWRRRAATSATCAASTSLRR